MIRDDDTSLNLATMTNIRLKKCIDEISGLWLRNSFLNHADGPRLEWLGVRKQELLATKVPATRVFRIGLRASILDLRGWEESSLSYSEVGINLETKGVQISISVPLQHAHAVLDGLQSLLRSKGRISQPNTRTYNKKKTYLVTANWKKKKLAHVC